MTPHSLQVNKLAADDGISETIVVDDVIKLPKSAPSAGGLGDGVGSDGEEVGIDMLGEEIGIDVLGEGMGWAKCCTSSPILTGELAKKEKNIISYNELKFKILQIGLGKNNTLID